VLAGKVQQSGLVLIAADQKGGVFAFDGTTGEPRWSRAANSAKRRDGVIPSPVIANSAKLSRLLLLSESGVGAVDLTNGAIAWEKNIEGEPIAFAAVDFEGRGEADFVVVTNLPSTAIVLNAVTGDIVSQTRLFAPVVALPVRFIDCRGPRRDRYMAVFVGWHLARTMCDVDWKAGDRCCEPLNR